MCANSLTFKSASSEPSRGDVPGPGTRTVSLDVTFARLLAPGETRRGRPSRVGLFLSREIVLCLLQTEEAPLMTARHPPRSWPRDGTTGRTPSQPTVSGPARPRAPGQRLTVPLAPKRLGKLIEPQAQVPGIIPIGMKFMGVFSFGL